MQTLPGIDSICYLWDFHFPIKCDILIGEFFLFTAEVKWPVSWTCVFQWQRAIHSLYSSFLLQNSNLVFFNIHSMVFVDAKDKGNILHLKSNSASKGMGFLVWRKRKIWNLMKKVSPGLHSVQCVGKELLKYYPAPSIPEAGPWFLEKLSSIVNQQQNLQRWARCLTCLVQRVRIIAPE